MIPITLTASPQYAFDLAQRDHNGEGVPRGRQTQFIVRVPIHVSSADKEVAVAFYVRGQVPMAAVEGISDSLARSFSVATAVAKSAFRFLPRCREWNLYGSTEIGVTEPVEEVSISTPSISAEVQIHPETAEILRAETKQRRDVKIAFEKAKEFLLRNMRYTGAGNEIRDAAHFIEVCRDREVWSYGDFMDDDRYDKLMPYIEHLLGLKNPHHPNVRAAEKAASLLYSARCPEFWQSPPPRPSQYGL